MHLLNNTFAIFWTRKGWKRQFHADWGKETPSQSAKEVVQTFRKLFPDDIVMSVRDNSGRFVAFK